MILFPISCILYECKNIVYYVLYVFFHLFQSLELFPDQANVKFFIIYNFFSHAWMGWQRIVVCTNKRKIQKDNQVNEQAVHEPIQDIEQALHEPIQDDHDRVYF